MNSDYKVITISRQYGAGGRTVAKSLSEKLGIPFYDNDFVKLTAKESGFSENDILREGEDISYVSRFVNSILNNSSSYTSSHDAIFDAQVRTILELAKEPCIIVGRCSNIILSAAKIRSFDIFLYADMEHRYKRAEELHENGSMDLKKFIEKRDKQRDIYYKTYTGHTPGMFQDYDICLNTGAIGMDNCVDILVNILK